ncbi:MAG: epmB [Planctomycetaceae bacterium]|nr:epmB [Planctomycetaceae bacterium]
MTILIRPTEESRPQRNLDSWQRQMAQAIRDPDELADLLELGPEFREPARRAAKLFPLLVPRGYVDLMERGNPLDPLLLQVLPLGAEEIVAAEFVLDAVGDHDAKRAPGLLHKYDGRALLITTGSCAIHCRYCFRRHYPYADDPKRLADWDQALNVLSNDTTIHEVILSGGDPLMLTDQRLSDLIMRIEAMPHVQRLRIHTRLPIVLPDRVTTRLLEILTGGRLTPIVVVHANHPQELSGRCATVLKTLVRSGCTVLNQAVLLKGVNDNAETLIRLCESLVDLGVLPYYLHQLDRVQGTAHFEVTEPYGRDLIATLRTRLPGYAVPEYVREVAGEKHKTPIV